MGGPLQGRCAVSYGAMLYVYPTSALPGRAWQCKASWQAHKSNVTALHRSVFGAQLISGASDGTIHLCGSQCSCAAHTLAVLPTVKLVLSLSQHGRQRLILQVLVIRAAA